MTEPRDRDLERLLLEARYPDAEVASGFSFRFEVQSDPARVLFEIGNRDSQILARLWFELDQFAEFAELVRQVAEDTGCEVVAEEPAD